MGPQVVGQRDALAAGPFVDEEAGLGGLAAAADVEGVDGAPPTFWLGCSAVYLEQAPRFVRKN
jgi:hypothetical protein